MRTALRHAAPLKHDDLIAVINRSQPMGHEYTRPTLFFEDAVDVLEKTLLRVGVQGRSLPPN